MSPADCCQVPFTIQEQIETQGDINKLFDSFEKDHQLQEYLYPIISKFPLNDNFSLELKRRLHVAYLQKGLEHLSSGYTSLDASKPWICYWILHSLDLLGIIFTDDLKSRAIATINDCQHPNGGYGGGPNQLPHLACTFAAISSLAIIGTDEAFDSINVIGLLNFLKRMKQPDGSFTVHEDGEVDVRGSYCAIASASLTGLLSEMELIENVSDFIKTCQSYEGGIGAVPFAEAHIGYTYCGVATLVILDNLHALDLHSLDRFAVLSQCLEAGGFRGRTNKLVDGCYSFWSGALFPMMRRYCPSSYFNSVALQKYLLICCQNGETGGMLDKPGKSEDYYHTCYCLSGLSVAQRESTDLEEEGGENEGGAVIGKPENLLHPVLPEYNLRPERVATIQKYFTKSIK